MTRSRSRAHASFLVLLFLTGCVNTFKTVQTHALPIQGGPAQPTKTLLTPVRAHLKDGTTVVYGVGAHIDSFGIAGQGMAYPLLVDIGTLRTIPVPMDSLVALETFAERTLVGASFVTTVAATALGTIGTAALAVAIFGSCPTVYADTGAGQMLQAEGFSYAIAPLFEHRDVDPLVLRPGTDGVLRLELRNEALETHLINHIELLAVAHRSGTLVAPDQSGRVAVVGDLRPVRTAVDRVGRDLSTVVRDRDGVVFASAPATLDAANPGDLDDWIDLTADDLPPGDSFAVVLRLRNSLLNTVLLYDGMLNAQDAPDLLGVDLHRIASAVEFGEWYRRSMGMRVAVTTPGTIRGEARLPDVGPIAFREVVVVLPRPTHDAASVAVRLRFIVDNWRIDQVQFAGSVARPEPVLLPIAKVVVLRPSDTGEARSDTAARAALAAPDSRYLETLPGQRLQLEFAAAAPPVSGDSTAYLIAWQGWYREWIRAQWLSHPLRTTPFVPGDAALFAAVTRWRTRQPGFEAQFYRSSVAVQ